MFLSAPARPAGSEKPETRAELIARVRVMRRAHMWQAVAPGLQETQDFSIYAAEGWRAQLSGCGSEDDGRLTCVTVHHYETEDADSSNGQQPRLAITTKLDDPQDRGPLVEARWALRGWVRPTAAPTRTPDTSHASTTLWIQARDREHHAAVLNAVQSEHTIAIDGSATAALMLTASASRWVAVAVRGELTIIIAGHDVHPDSLRLTPIANPTEKFAPQPTDA